MNVHNDAIMMVFVLYLRLLCLLTLYNYFAGLQGKQYLISLICSVYKKKSQCTETRNRVIILMMRGKGKQEAIDQTGIFLVYFKHFNKIHSLFVVVFFL